MSWKVWQSRKQELIVGVFVCVCMCVKKIVPKLVNSLARICLRTHYNNKTD